MIADKDCQRGALHTVKHIGDVVHRPVNRWTPAVHDLLRFLENTGFQGVPRLRGVEAGHEILTYIEGTAGLRPWPVALRTDSGLVQMAGFLRSYHLAVKDYILPANIEWCVPDLKWRPGWMVRHGDLGPWNTIWHNGVLTGVIDWDFAEPGETIMDVAQVAWYHVPLRGSDYWRDCGFEEPPVLRDRLNVLCEAYGAFSPKNVMDALVDLQESEIARISNWGSNGVEPWSAFYRKGHLEVIKRERDWLKEVYRNLI